MALEDQTRYRRRPIRANSIIDNANRGRTLHFNERAERLMDDERIGASY